MSFAETFNEMKRIYGFCPCCGEIFRLSDATLLTRIRPPKTSFDRLRERENRLVRQQQRFDDAEEQIRDEARRLGQLAARRRLRAIAPFFSRRRIELRDVKVLFHPVEYIVFRGMSGKNCLSVDFIDHPAESVDRERIQSSLQATISSGRIDWQTFRIDEYGRVKVEGSRDSLVAGMRIRARGPR